MVEKKEVMIQVEMCRGCHRSLFIHPVANLVVRLETEALDGPQAIQELLGGRSLWRVTQTSVTPASKAVLEALGQRGNTEGPYVCREHRCTVAGVPPRPPVVQGHQNPPREPSVGRTAPSSGPRTARPAVPSAVKHRSDDGPRCDDCGLIMQPGEYISVQLGEVYLWAQHDLNCGKVES